MKIMKKCLVMFLCILIITGCSNKKGISRKGINTVNSVDKVINNQIEKEDSKTETTESENSLINDEMNEYTKDELSKNADNRKTEGTVDYDLTQMSSDMVYATVYQMMATPEEYEGKTFRIEGNFYETYYEVTKKYYFYCVIQDATECCAQGMEFVWEDGTHIYPDEYPKDNDEIIVEGTFETYTEENQYVYCRLSNATLQQKN